MKICPCSPDVADCPKCLKRKHKTHRIIKTKLKKKVSKTLKRTKAQ